MHNREITPPFLFYRGPMSERIERMDWSQTPLGARQYWPPSLKTAVTIMLGSSQPMLTTWGAQGIALYNDRFADLIDGHRHQPLGRPLFESWPDELHALRALLTRAYEGEPTSAANSPVIEIDEGHGSSRQFVWDCLPLGGGGDRIAGALLIAVEASAEQGKQASRREANKALLVELHREFTSLTNSDQIMEVVGRGLAEHLGIARINFARVDKGAQYFKSIYDWTEREGTKYGTADHRIADFMGRSLRAKFKSGETVAIEDINADPRTAPYADAYARFDVRAMLQVPHISDGRWKFQLAVHHDAPRVWRDDEIELLCDVTERLWLRLERAYAEEALREANQRKDRFLAMLSHELRNPLAPIELSLHLLDETTPESNEWRRAREVIERQVKQLTRLVDDLLDINRITSDKIQLQVEPLELNELIRHTVQDHHLLLDENDIELKADLDDEPILIEGDRNRLSQVIGNLLQNASKFTESGGRVTLAVDCDYATRHGEIRVKDTGSGIDPDKLPTLFDPFMQGDAGMDRSMGGLGLGLALVKGLVELHGGEVSASSEGIGKGSEFLVRLPLQKNKTTEIPAQPTDEESIDAKKILLIEDNVDVAELMHRVLELRGHLVEVANSGKAGLESAQRNHFDVIICDLGLPELNGFDVAKAIRGDDRLRSIQLIALSGYARPEDIEKSRQAGFDHHLAKPPNLSDLDALLDD